MFRFNSNNEREVIRISHKWLSHNCACSLDYILSNCKGSCCFRSGKQALITLLPFEIIYFIQKGYDVKGNVLQFNPSTKRCPCMNERGLCKEHNTGHKPFGCITSPLTLNKNGTLVLRQRYSVMKCFGKGKPIYRVFKASFDLLFGEEEANRIVAELDKGSKHVVGHILIENLQKLIYLDYLKKRR